MITVMLSPRGWPARTWHALTVAVVVAAITIQLVQLLRGNAVLTDTTVRPPVPTRIIRFLSYFTVQSNILVAITSGWLVLRPDVSSVGWRVLRLSALVGISVTGVVYFLLLRPIVDVHGADKVADVLFHYVAPLAAVVGWLLFGPRPRIDDRILGLSLIWPALYVVYSLLHGAATHWYPYPFVDVTKLGYVTMTRNAVLLLMFLLGVGFLYRWLDRLLAARWSGGRDS